MTMLWRLAWALPLVLVVGTVVMLILRRFVQPSPLPAERPKLSVRGSVTLSDKTSMHLVDVDGKEFLIVESAQQTSVQLLAAAAIEPARRVTRLNAAWLQRFQKTGAR